MSRTAGPGWLLHLQVAQLAEIERRKFLRPRAHPIHAGSMSPLRLLAPHGGLDGVRHEPDRRDTRRSQRRGATAAPRSSSKRALERTASPWSPCCQTATAARATGPPSSSLLSSRSAAAIPAVWPLFGRIAASRRPLYRPAIAVVVAIASSSARATS